MKVPFLELASVSPAVRRETEAAVGRVIRRGQFVLGPEVDGFEREFAEYTHSAHCVGVGNGLDALELAMSALGLQPGDEVIVPANTYIASWLAVSRAGGRPVPVEPVEATYNIDPDRVEAVVTPRTRGIMAVHLYGQPADLPALRGLADQHGLWLVEDAAQAHGARIENRPVGSWGDAAAWSFYPTKNLGAIGDAGAVTTNSSEVAERVSLLRNYGSTERYRHRIRGTNSRLDEVQAAVLRTRLKRLDAENNRRRRVARRYLSGLAGLKLGLPMVDRRTEHVWHLFVVRSRDRDGLRAHLEAAGVGTLIHYPIPPHLQAAYADMGMTAGALPITEAIHGEILSIPMRGNLSDGAVEHVIAAITTAPGV